MTPTLGNVQTVTTRAYDWVKKSRKPAPLGLGAPVYSGASAWGGPWSLSTLPGSGTLQAQDDYVIGSSIAQDIWRGGQAWSRTIPLTGDVPDWGNASSWSGPYSTSGLPGSGDIQLLGNFVVGTTLYQEFWRGNLGYRRTVPIVGGVVQWGSAGSWSSAIALSTFPGSGTIQTLDFSLIDNVVSQNIWRGNQGWTRTIPLDSNGAPNWGAASSWAGPWSVSALPGSGDMQSASDFVAGNIVYQNFWRNGQGYSRTIPIASYQDAISMYRALPITMKVPPGYTIPPTSDTVTACDYVRHLGSEMKRFGVPFPSIRVYPSIRTDVQSGVWLEIGNWADGQPSLWFWVLRTYNATNGQTTVDVYYSGKPSGDTRAYPVQLYWGPIQIMNDHRMGAKWIWHGVWGAAVGQRGNKYFQRTEDIVALKLLESEPDNSKLSSWCVATWSDTDADIHAPLFDDAQSKANNYMYQTGIPMYRDCTMNHQGCPSDWAADTYRWDSTSWGFSHRSKVCIWQGGYTWVLAQDPLGLLAQAIHKLNVTNNPWATITDSWPTGVPGKPTSMTVIGIAEWVRDTYYRPGVGVTMYQVPIIGSDQRASSLRTNQFAILTTLLGYRYLVGGWASYADALADILIDVSIGGPGQPAYGCKTAELGNINRPDYFGAQLYVWDYLDGSGATSSGTSPAGAGVTGLGLKDFGWLRQTINEYLNLPHDDEDFILSTIETTATYCQALRTYGYHKYGWLYGPSATIPGY